MGSPSCSLARLGRAAAVRVGEDLEVQLLVEYAGLALDRSSEQLRAHRGHHPVVTRGVVAQHGAQLRRHERGIAGGAQQVLVLTRAGVFLCARCDAPDRLSRIDDVDALMTAQGQQMLAIPPRRSDQRALR